MSEAPRVEPEWVQRMRAAGYNIRVGTGEPMSEIPEVMFDPPTPRFTAIRQSIVQSFRNLLRLQPPSGRATNAPLP